MFNEKSSYEKASKLADDIVKHLPHAPGEEAELRSKAYKWINAFADVAATRACERIRDKQGCG